MPENAEEIGGVGPRTDGSFEPRFAATAIGSLPHTDVSGACRLMLENLPEIPVWPQLVKRSFLENMYVQYSEGLPGIRIDTAAERVWFDSGPGIETELEEFYQGIIEEDFERFAMSESYASGLAMFTDELAGELAGLPFVKGQVTGPISFGLTVTDENKRASLYNETLEEAIVKGLTLKARWQSDGLKKAAPAAEVILFVDEPYLVSVGSALISVSREQVVEDISECLRGCGADLTGIHCCGNTDWSIVFETGADIVNFDAFDFMEGFIAYAEDIAGHLERGGTIAWGIVPNCEKVLEVGAEGLADRLESAFDSLEESGLDRELLARRAIVTPACGLGPTTTGVAEAALAMNREVAELLRGRYFDNG